MGYRHKLTSALRPRGHSTRTLAECLEIRLDLRVTVRANQEPLRRFRSHRVQRARDALVGDAERLACRIDVMELKSPGEPVVPTKRARAAGLRDEDLLYLAASRGDPLA